MTSEAITKALRYAAERGVPQTESEHADTVIRALAEQGYQVVPVEPTEEMLTAAVHVKRPDQDRRSRLTIRDLLRLEYSAMLSAVK